MSVIDIDVECASAERQYPTLRNQMDRAELAEYAKHLTQLGFPSLGSTFLNSFSTKDRIVNENLLLIVNPSNLEQLSFTKIKTNYKILFPIGMYKIKWETGPGPLLYPRPPNIKVEMHPVNPKTKFVGLSLSFVPIQSPFSFLGALKVFDQKSKNDYRLSCWWIGGKELRHL